MNRKLIASMLWLPACSLFAQTSEQATYQQALEQARSGQVDAALAQLQRLAAEHPKRKKYIYDYLQVLGWTDRSEDVLREAENINLQRAPAYVLEAVAKAARNQGLWNKATELYIKAAQKTPNRLAPKLGIGWVLQDQKQFQAAIEYFEQLAQTFPDDAELMLALADALAQNGQIQRAEQLYQNALNRQQDSKNAALSLVKIQAAREDFPAALATANTHRQAISDVAWAELNWDYATWLVRQGEKALTANPGDFSKTDQAIAVLEANLAALPKLDIKNGQDWQIRAEADLWVALHDRHRMADLIARFQQIQQQNLVLPIYARIAVANAFLAQKQIRNAHELYRIINREQPENFDVLIALAKTSLELGDSRQIALILPLLAQFADTYAADPNYRYDYLRILQWSGRNRETLAVAEKIDLDIAPASVLETIAKAARELRNYPQAEKLYRMARDITPDRLTPRLGLGLLMLDQHQGKQASHYFDTLVKTGSQNAEVLWAQAQAHEMAGQPKQASQLYQAILDKQAQHQEASRGLIRSLAAAGLSAQALHIAKQQRSLVPDEQWADLNGMYAAGLIRQGETALQDNPDDFHYTDQAIAAITTNLKAVSELNIPDKRSWCSKATGDLLVALHDRQRFAEVNDTYQQAQTQNLALPNYALLAVADSRMKNQQPALARDLYLRVIADEPDNQEALVGLVRAYMETEQQQDIDPVLIKIQALAEQNPQQPRYRYDLVQVLSWLERDESVLQQAQLLKMDSAPIYVLESVARSARNQQDYRQAEHLYTLAADTAPDHLPPQLALAGLMLDQQQYSQADIYLLQLRQRYPTDTGLILTQANAQVYAGQPHKAAEFYRQALEVDSLHPEALRGLAFTLADSENTEAALQTANQHRALFTDEEWAGIKWKHAGALVREGEAALAEDARDYRSIELAISELIDNMALTEQLNLKNPDHWRQQARFDLLVALRDRRRMSDVIDLYQQLVQQSVAIPVYARMAAGDAYLNNRQSELARDIYLGVINEKPDYFNAKLSLAYAYLEAEQLDLALMTVEDLSKYQPETIAAKQADGSEVNVPNPQKATAEMTAALFHAYLDDLKGAQSRLEQLHLQYPANTDIHSKLAEVYYYRGWPRKAQQEIDIARQQAPEHMGIKLDQARVAHELRDYRQEGRLTHDLNSDYPEDSGVQKQMQAWRRHNKPELKVFAGGGLSDNEATRSNDFISSNNAGIDAFLYSNPIGIKRDFRLFVHEGWKTGLYKEGRGDLFIQGIGAEYVNQHVLATIETHYDNFESEAIGVDLGVDYQIDDQWQIFTRLSSLDNNISLRALSTDVTAKSARFGTNYRVNESRQFTVSGKYTNFSDNNDRFEINGDYFERWHSGPIYKFATNFDVGYSTNTSQAGAYFSPKQDAVASFTFDNDWLTYRHYETDLHQRLALSAGNYWQEDFGSNPIGSIQYEHRWHLGNDIELSYGGVRSYRYFDAELTENWQFYLTADIRF